MNSEFAQEYTELNEQHIDIVEQKKTLQMDFAENPENLEVKDQIQSLQAMELENRETAKEIILKADPSQEVNDKDYVFIHFILNNLPRGLIGLLLAVILSAAMSSTASELNALAATTTMDLYKRNDKKVRDDMYYVTVTKWFTLAWGILAILVASVANLFDNLIQLVNIIGSIFYGNILGIFLIAFFIKYIRGNAVFIAALITQVLIIWVYAIDVLPYLWLNLLGCALVISLAILIQMFSRQKAL